MKTLNFRSLGLLSLTLGLAMALGACGTTGTWSAMPTEGSAAKLNPGKTLQTRPAPAGGAVLIERDEGEQGDFVWHTLYVKTGGQYTSLGTFNEVTGVSWSADGQVVSFQARKAVSFDQIEAAEYRYTLDGRLLQKRVIHNERVEG